MELLEEWWSENINKIVTRKQAVLNKSSESFSVKGKAGSHG